MHKYISMCLILIVSLACRPEPPPASAAAPASAASAEAPASAGEAPASAPPASAAAEEFDPQKLYDDLYAKCTAGCSEESRKTRSPTDPEKNECEFLCNHSAESESGIMICRNDCIKEKNDDGSPKTAAQCADECNPDRVEEDEAQ